MSGNAAVLPAPDQRRRLLEKRSDGTVAAQRLDDLFRRHDADHSHYGYVCKVKTVIEAPSARRHKGSHETVIAKMAI